VDGDDAERLPLEADLIEPMCANLCCEQFCGWKLAYPMKQILVSRGVTTSSKPSERGHAQRHISEIGGMQRPPGYVGGFQQYQPAAGTKNAKCLIECEPAVADLEA
jgi:hypothetical protein